MANSINGLEWVELRRCQKIKKQEKDLVSWIDCLWRPAASCQVTLRTPLRQTLRLRSDPARETAVAVTERHESLLVMHDISLVWQEA